MKRSIIILAVVVAAVLVPVALAKPTPYSSTQFYTPEALNAWGLRMQAQAQYYLTHGSGAAADDRIVSVGKPASSFYTPAALKAMGERANAQADFYLTQGSGADDRIVSVGKPASSFYTPAALKAMGERANAQADFYLSKGTGVGSDDRVGGIRGTGPVSTITPVSDDGFGSWDKVGIGLAGALFALLLGAGLMFTVRRSKVAHA